MVDCWPPVSSPGQLLIARYGEVARRASGAMPHAQSNSLKACQSGKLALRQNCVFFIFGVLFGIVLNVTIVSDIDS